MKLHLKIFLFLLVMVAGILAVSLLFDTISLTEAQEIGLKTGGAIGVGYLVILSGYLLFNR